MRQPLFRASRSGELVIDSFAGGGGASTGIERAIGRPVDIAINHSAQAIAMHAANHPRTKHYQEDIFEVDPKTVCGRRPVGKAWFSPDCTHFSKAKGTQPLKNEIRGLAWVAVNWAREVKPRRIYLENVEEFANWGPLLDTGRPDPARMGETFRAWLGAFSDLGYTAAFRLLTAADYGTPTTRKRLFMVLSRDREPVVWPEASHGKGRPESWVPAANIIDWGLPCPSIFERKRPLAEATMRRIAAGIQRYVVGCPSPFLVKYYGTGGPADVGEPLDTVTTRDRFGLISPFVAPLTHHDPQRGRDLRQPLPTITAAHRGELALASPFLVRHGHYSTITGAGLREGCGAGTFRGQPLVQPLGAVCGTNDKHLVAPVIVPHYGGKNGHQAAPHDVRGPLGSVTAKDHHSLAAALITKFYGTSTGSDMHAPLPTVTANGRGGGHLAEVQAFLIKFHGGSRGHMRGQTLDLPLRTVDTNNRFGLVMIEGEAYEIVDIGMRMLQPHELFAAQGFPPDYVIDPEYNGRRLNKTEQIKLAGNAVCSQVSHALVAANP